MAVLSPEHLDDLKRSGLNDDIIERLGFFAVRPHELKHLRGVTSAYALPYHNLDGSVNCATRWKLFPSITTPDGHTQKYYQAPGSAPSLYLSPLFSWATVATDASSPIILVEGEKKAAAMCQQGRVCAGVAGTWNWRQKLDNGERLVIPILDQFSWQGRSVELIADSDAWREEKMLNVLSGFYALGQELISRGASITLVKLPEQGARKAGLDDWLVATGADWTHQWPHLERLPLDDTRLAPVAAWWQRWREKQATQSAIRQHDADELEIAEAAGLYTVRSPKHGVSITFERLTDARDSVYAEVAIVIGATEILSGCKLGLQSDSGQSKLASSLKLIPVAIPWKFLLQKACSFVLRRHRQGEPIAPLQASPSALVPYLVNPVVHRGHQTLIYAPGGTCKSYLALYFALLACHGACESGVSALKVNVLYLDWELNADTLGGRLTALQAGHPSLTHHVPFYRRCELPLHQEASTIAAFVAQHDVQLVIVDSAAMACGGELSSPEAAIALQRALRKINCASIVLAHVSKSIQEGQERTAFGTVFFRELARNVWELSKSDEEHPVQLVLNHTKHNFCAKHPPLGFRITFAGEAVRVEAEDVASVPAFQPKLPTPAKIRNLLEDGRLRTAKTISEELEVPLNTIKSALSRGKGTKWQQIGDDYHDPTWTVLRAK